MVKKLKAPFVSKGTWGSLSSKDMYVILTEDVSDSFSRYFMPVRGLIIGAEKTFGAPYYWGYNKDKDKDKAATG